MHLRSSVFVAPARAVWLSVVLALGAVHCGGASAPPETPDNPPPLEDEGVGPATPSSAKVKEGADAIQAQDFAKAKTLLEAAVAENPKDAQAHYYLGVALESLGDGKAAAEHYEAALSVDPKLSEASVNLSGVLLDLNDPAGALVAADRGLKSSPKSPALLRNRAAALSETDSKEAIPAIKAALDAAPDDKDLRYLYAEALARSGDTEGAARELKPLIAGDDVAVLASAARLLGKLKAYDDCVAALDRAIAKKDAAELRVQRGLCKHGKKDDAGAGADFTAASTADPTFAPAFYYLGQHLRSKGDKKGARAALGKAAELDKGKLGEAAKSELAELK